MSDLKEIVTALAVLKAAEASAVGYGYGSRARALIQAKKKLAALLWEHREAIVNMIKETAS